MNIAGSMFNAIAGVLLSAGFSSNIHEARVHAVFTFFGLAGIIIAYFVVRAIVANIAYHKERETLAVVEGLGLDAWKLAFMGRLDEQTLSKLVERAGKCPLGGRYKGEIRADGVFIYPELFPDKGRIQQIPAPGNNKRKDAGSGICH